jgi:hypothetical protein
MKKHTLTRFIFVGLVFFFLLNSCRDDKKELEEIEIVWENNKAVELIIPKKLFQVVSLDGSQPQVFLDSANAPAILGASSIGVTSEFAAFKPLIPFTRGLRYRVTVNNKTIGTIDIPSTSPSDEAKVVAVYPTRDTIPENLLKIYIEFSKPMREGEALQHLTLIKNGKDSLQSTFLDLEPELWNNDRTILTVWLDPGRIKRGLQPNLAMGPPLIKGNKYTLIVKQDWKNQDGAELQRDFIKNFITIEYDSLSLDPDFWKIRIPNAGTLQSLNIDFKESLDYMLIRNAIHITNLTGMEVPGAINVYPGEVGFAFTPAVPWEKGDYYLLVETRLEDLAGNNLNHLFDTDIIYGHKKSERKNYLKKISLR